MSQRVYREQGVAGHKSGHDECPQIVIQQEACLSCLTIVHLPRSERLRECESTTPPPSRRHVEDMTGTLSRVSSGRTLASKRTLSSKRTSSTGVVQRFHKNGSRHRKIIVRLRESLTCLVLLKAKLPELINLARINVPCRFVRDNGILNHQGRLC